MSIQDESKVSQDLEILAHLVRAREPLISDDPDVVLPTVLVPPNYQLESLERFAPNPWRKRSKLVFDNLESFVQYIKDDQSKTPAVFCCVDPASPAIECILDYHEGLTPGWCEHRASINFELTQPWRDWQNSNKKRLPQLDFCEFLEDRSGDVVEPQAAEVVQACSKFEAKRAVQFVRAICTETGMLSFQYEEKTAGLRDSLTLHSKLKLGLKPFASCAAHYPVQAQIRYRLDASNGSLQLFYVLDRPEKVIETACLDLVNELNSRLDASVPVYFATVPR